MRRTTGIALILSAVAAASHAAGALLGFPPPIGDLGVDPGTATVTSLTLEWSAPPLWVEAADGDAALIGGNPVGGTIHAMKYDLRWSTEGAIDTETKFAAAVPVEGLPVPALPGTPEQFVVGDLTQGTTYWFCIRAGYPVDSGMVWSGISPPAWGTTQTDSVPPAAIGDLAVLSSTATSIRLRWTAVGGDGMAGRAQRYELRYSVDPITTDPGFAAATPVFPVPTPASAGSVEQAVATGLAPSTLYWFSIRAYDEAQNPGPLPTVPLFGVTAAGDAGEGSDSGGGGLCGGVSHGQTNVWLLAAALAAFVAGRR